MQTEHIQPVKTTRDLIDRWERANEHVKSLKSQLNSAECEVLNSTNELGRHMAPKNVKPDETFNIWFSDGLLHVAMLNASGMGDFDVSWRQRPTKM